MNALVFTLWMLNVLVDTGGQLAFKAAASDNQHLNGLAYWTTLFKRPWIWVGIVCYVAEFFLWLAFLSQVPLSDGVMLGSINIVAIMIAGRILFKEQITPWRATGIVLISLGVAIVGAGS